MPTMTIYLTNDLYDKIKHAPSKTVRAALVHYFKDDDEDSAPPQEPGKNKDAPGSE